ncbi:TPA: allantoate amidohydrolase [Klebsiella michiganensis]|jgi:allantoate deiminase|uniref:allantoate amidohydrolase n=1 Tax=Klebsiella TaxID=570 RepID=UPI000667A0EA|nr:MULTISPECIES: allantoate amidohydrolase [Klebsiella]EKV5144763.1 allantoate amidohydrolase [Klebsiella michiganensis]EKW0785722.1 allantoate amidohydrolase [Klebsiella michiganensis]ELT9729318.1 allantoate amidohydrolase [Klebsiella michiganensis]MBA4427850.1 allantoate amidohydrolase [Klebsiella michiganensis]MBK6272670.1 allantoate amidohydrolase [Klebsiella michiganensis]
MSPAQRQQAEMQQAAARVMARADELAAISETPDALTRVYLSPQHLEANQRAARWMTQAGMTVWQDSVGNICGRYEGEQEGAPAILLGSHLDTVRNAGRYDGMLGVLTAIEVVHGLHQQGRRLKQAIEIVGFCDEEGTRFGITLLGSRGITGTWPESWLAQTDADGVSVAQAMVLAGLDPARIHLAARRPEEIAAYLELHIEQGPCLEQEGLALGVVEAINGARRLNCRFTGEAGHAGTVPMSHRKDALAAAAEWMVRVETLTREQGGNRVATVGTLRCAPGAVNVIPGDVTLTLDIRGPHDQPLDALLDTLLKEAQAIASRRQLRFSAEEFYRIAATACDSGLQQVLSEAVQAVQGRSLTLPSGAGHDAIAIAERWPSAMLFVRCKGGISHHPAESVTADDVALAIAAYSRAVSALDAGK